MQNKYWVYSWRDAENGYIVGNQYGEKYIYLSSSHMHRSYEPISLEKLALLCHKFEVKSVIFNGNPVLARDFILQEYINSEPILKCLCDFYLDSDSHK